MASATNEKKFPKRWLDRITCLQVLNLMVILGFMFNYMLRVNLTIAIVAMAVPIVKNDTVQLNVSECGVALHHPVAEPLDNWTTSDTEMGMDVINEDRFDWDEYQQNLIHGSFFWGYICTELPGGRLAEIVGGKRVFGYSMLFSSIITLVTPYAAKLSYIAVIILRALLGFFLGATWPAIHPMVSRWIPPMDRSKFMSNMMASSLGAAITMPVCGFLIDSVGWESVFYVTGVIGLVWSIIWFLVIFDSPALHPRISDEEKTFIQTAIGTTVGKKHKALEVPWRSIFTSAPVWAIIITHGASVFGYFTVVNQLPTYMKHILSFNIKENGLLSSLPYLGKYIFAVLISYLADHLRKSGKLTTTATRKIFTTFALIIPSALMFAQIFVACNRTAAVAFFTIALTVNGAVTAGYLGNGLDIAPNFSGTIFGMANTLSSLGGFLSSVMVGDLTYQNQTQAAWRVVFGVLAGTYALGALTFLIFGTGELQSWNSPPKTVEEQLEEEESKIESIPLKKNEQIT